MELEFGGWIADMDLPLSFLSVLCLCAVFMGTAGKPEDCERWDDLDTAVVHKDGHVVLAGMFPIHSKGVEKDHSYKQRPGRRKCQG